MADCNWEGVAYEAQQVSVLQEGIAAGVLHLSVRDYFLVQDR